MIRAALVCCVAMAAAYPATALPPVAEVGPVVSQFDHFAKPVTPTSLVTGGRLIRRHLDYLSHTGFKSVVSIFPFETAAEWFGVPGDWLSSADQTTACEAAGMNSTYFAFGNATFTPDSFKQVSAAIDRLPKPLYLHCHVGWTADLFAQLHQVTAGQASATTFFHDTRDLGWDFQADPDVVSLVAAVTGEAPAPLAPHTIDLDLAGNESGYQSFYWAHRVGNSDGFYNIGQVLSTQVKAIAAAGASKS